MKQTSVKLTVEQAKLLYEVLKNTEVEMRNEDYVSLKSKLFDAWFEVR